LLAEIEKQGNLWSLRITRKKVGSVKPRS
jgi:hypothetical protein